MRISTAYFAGVGTVVVAVAAGLGGGYLAANITSPPSQTVSKLERRMSAEPIAVSTAPAEPVPRVAATNSASPPAQEPPQTQQQPQPQTQAAAPSANNAPAEEEKTASNAAVAQPVQPPQPAKPAEQASERTAAPQETNAKARDADVKRVAAEQRRAERHQRWADRRRFQQPREQELEAVEGSVREVTEPRRIRIREEAEPRGMFVEPARSEMPRIRLFDQD
jgi:outer membrane biosynthesis protein TonB